jgi:hypothetical protein
MLSLVLIGFMRFDNKDTKGLKYAHDAMVQELERRPQSKRLQRFEAVFRGLRHLADHKVGNALELARQLSAEADGEDFDLEAASLLVGLWIRLSKLAIQLDEMGPVMSQLGLRFCTSKASSELLVSVSEDNEAVANEFRSCHTRIFGVAETAMRHSMRGSARTGVELLIQQGESTRNAKLIDMASLVLKRHAEKIDDAEQLAERISELQARYVIPIASLNNRNRAAGGLALRTGAPS